MAYKQDLRQAIQLEQSAIGDWQEILSDPMGYAVDLWYDYLDWLDPPFDMMDYLDGDH